MSLSRPLDHRTDDLKKDKQKVDGFRVSALLAEEALKLSIRVDIGSTQISTKHLGGTVLMTLDGYSGHKHVRVHETDRVLAVRIAVRVRRELHRLGFEVKGVRIKAKGCKANVGEEHDLVLELVDWVDSDTQFKKFSCELKCRRMMTQTGLADVREAMQEECVDELGWWQREAATGAWEGRIVLLCNFPSGGSAPFDVYADYTPVGHKPRGLLGWKYSRKYNLLPPKKELTRVRSSPPVAAKAKAAAKATPRPTPARHVKKPFPQLKYRRWKGRLVAPLAPVVEAATLKPAFHLDRRIEGWASRVPNGFADQAPRDSSKKGGIPEYVATAPVLEWVYDNLP